MKSVPGAIATGSPSISGIALAGLNPVATAPGTDLNLSRGHLNFEARINPGLGAPGHV